jgi:hypothetical protein
MTKEYLKLVAEKASLDVSVSKLSSQLVETKMKLTTLEAEHLTLKEETDRKIVSLERELEEKNKLLETIQQRDGLETNTTANLASKKDQVKELRSAVTAWVSSTVSKRPGAAGTGNGDTLVAATSNGHADGAASDATSSPAPGKDNNDVTQIVFGSLKEKGTDFFEKIKQKGGEELEKIKKPKKGPSKSKGLSTKQKVKDSSIIEN